MAKRNVGRMGCGCCGNEVVVKANENDTLSYTCQWCDDTQYWRKGTMAHTLTVKKMKPLEGGEVVEVAAVPVPPVAKPAPKSAGTLLG